MHFERHFATCSQNIKLKFYVINCAWKPEVCLPEVSRGLDLAKILGFFYLILAIGSLLVILGFYVEVTEVSR